MAYIASRHDIGILRTDGSTKVGMMLVNDKNGAPVYETYDENQLQNHVWNGAPDYGSIDPQLELPIIMDDWRNGFGQTIFDSTDPKRYKASYNFDLRFKNMGFLAQKATAATLPTLYTLTNGNLESWDSASDATGWTEAVNGAGSTVTREAGTIHGGTYSARLYSTAGAGNYARITQVLGNWAAIFQGKLVTVKGWANTAAATTTRIGINDGVGTTWSSYHTGGGAWEQLTVTRQLNASATQIQILFDNTNAVGGEAFVDDITINSYGAHGSCWEEFNGDLYFASNDILLKVPASTGTIAYVAGFPAAITDIEDFTDNNLYVAQGNSKAYYYLNTSETCTLSTDTDPYAYYFKAVGATMWKATTPYSIYSATDPTNPGGGSNWSAAVTVGASSEDITDLLTDGTLLYIMKEDRPFFRSAAGVITVLTEETKSLMSSTSGKNSILAFGNLYMPWGTQSLLEYDIDADTKAWRDPSLQFNNLSDFDGAIQALASDDRFVYCAVDNSTKVEILSGAYEDVDGSTDWIWHSWAEITLTGAATMYVSSVYQKRLWVASTSAGDSLYYIPLPDGYGDVVNDTNRSFQTSGYFETGFLHGGFKGDDKGWIKITLTMEGVDSNVYLQGAYKKSGDSSWTSIGNFQTLPTTTKYIPVDGSSNNPVSEFMDFKFTGVTNDTTKTPVLKQIDIRTILYPVKKSLIFCQVKAADEVLDKQGSISTDNAKAVNDALAEAKGRTWPSTFYDIDGTTKYVRFLPIKPFSKVVRNEKSRKFERIYNLLLMEVTLS